MAPDSPAPFEAGNPSSPSSQPSQSATEENYEYGDDMQNSCVRWVIVLIVLLLIAIGAWYFFLKGKKLGFRKPSQTVTSSTKDPNLIGMAGGEVRHSSGAKIVIPAGALDRDLRIQIEKVRDGRVTDLYHLKPDGLRFIKPVKVIIPYKEGNLYTWETPYDITLWYGEEEDSLNERKRTTVLWSEKKVATEVLRF